MGATEVGARSPTHSTHARPVVADAQNNGASPNREAPKSPAKPGSAGGSNTTWSRAPVSPGSKAKAPQATDSAASIDPLDRAAIDEAYRRVVKAWHKVGVAGNNLSPRDETSATAYRNAPPRDRGRTWLSYA